MTTPTIHQVTQGSDEWRALRCGMLTASEMKLIMTPKLKPADNSDSRKHLYELLAQRITGHVEPHYISDDMLRGHGDEVRARALYAEKYEPVEEVGFVTREFTRRDGLTMTLGCSPDALIDTSHVGVAQHHGLECKSRRAKYQIETILGIAAGDRCPPDYMLQIQTCMLVCDRHTWRFVSYSGGLPMVVAEVGADAGIQSAILDNCFAAEDKIRTMRAVYDSTVAKYGWHPTERTILADGEIHL